MVSCRVIVLLVYVNLAFATEELDISGCGAKCAGDFWRNVSEQDACDRGCAFGKSLKTATGPGAHTNCLDSCTEAYKGHQSLINACETSCASQTTSETDSTSLLPSLTNLPIISGFPWFVQHAIKRMHELMENHPGDSPASYGSPEGPLNHHYTIIRIRFHPKGGEDDNQPINFPGLLPELSDDLMKAPKSTKAELPVKTTTAHVVFDRMKHTAFQIAAHPLTFLLALTVASLFVLLIVQMAVCIRSRRSRNYRYVSLPTYTEATSLKVPLMADGDDEKDCKDKAKVPDA